MSRVLGVLLAGGRGRRLGLDVPKALARVGGVTLFERALRTLAAACDAVLVVAPRGIELPGEFRRVHDEGQGPLAAVVVALEHQRAESVVVLGVDYPRMPPETLTALVARLDAEPAGRGGGRAVVPVQAGMAQPLAAVYDTAACDRLVERWRAGERSFVAALQALEVTVVAGDELARLPGGVESFLNVNTPSELAEVERWMSAPERTRR